MLYFLGASSLGLAYGVVLTDAVLALCIPSCAARAAGIILPILQPLMTDAFKSSPDDGPLAVHGAFLVHREFSGVITNGTFWRVLKGF